MEKKIKKEWLDNIYNYINLITDVSEEAWNDIISKSKYLDINKNDFFIQAGMIPDKIAFILSGLFRVFYITEDGNEKTLVFREEGRILSAFSAYVANESSWYSIQALENSILSYISFNDYKEIIENYQCWQIIKSKYLEMLFIEKEKRESELLSDDAYTRYKKFKLKYPNLEDRVNQYHIASYLGITPVALSRIKNKNKY